MSDDMNQKPDTDPSSLPWLGRKLLWLDNLKNVDRIGYALLVICAALLAVDFFYHRHTKVPVESVPGFYALYGFFMSAIMVIGARALRFVLKRPQDYYAPHGVESEAYPEDQLSRKTIND